MKVEFGTLITIITISIAIGSAYYAVQDDIVDLQTKVSILEKKIKRCVRKKNSKAK